MNKLLKGEMMKLLKSFPLKILFLLMLGLSVITTLSSMSYVGNPNAEIMEVALYGYSAFLSSLRDTPTIGIIGVIVIGLLVCGDFENRTIQMEIAAGYSRSQILFSKLFAVSIAYVLVFLPYPLGRAILQGIFIGFGVPVTLGAIANMLGVFLVVIAVGMAINGLTFLIAFMLRKTVIVMGVGFVLVILGGSAALSFSITNPGLGAILAKTPLGLLKALAVAEYAPVLLLQALSISIVCVLVFMGITNMLFCKAELK